MGAVTKGLGLEFRVQGYIGALHWGYTEIMENRMETTATKPQNFIPLSSSHQKNKKGFVVWVRWTPHPVIVTIGDSSNYIRVLLYSYYTTITGWGVLLRYGALAPRTLIPNPTSGIPTIGVNAEPQTKPDRPLRWWQKTQYLRLSGCQPRTKPPNKMKNPEPLNPKL